jgi:hypothetical protein
VNTRSFTFVGYLIQEPYWTAWPMREGYRVASIEREWHPLLNKYQWNKVNGSENPTRFLTEPPDLTKLALEPHDCRSLLHRRFPGWVVSGYAFPQDFVERRTMTSSDGKHALLEFGYALNLRRPADNLNLLGYEVVDADDIFLSILNNCGYTVERVREMAGPLNEYSLFSSQGDAERFEESIKTDPVNPGIIPDHNRGVIAEIWGRP